MVDWLDHLFFIVLQACLILFTSWWSQKSHGQQKRTSCKAPNIFQSVLYSVSFCPTGQIRQSQMGGQTPLLGGRKEFAVVFAIYSLQFNLAQITEETFLSLPCFSVITTEQTSCMNGYHIIFIFIKYL